MDVINKLYSSVSSTVSHLSGVLPGNPVTREYEATQHIASAGPGLIWKVYKGYKKSTKQEVAIFVFEKRYLERWTKGDRDMMIETLKRGITQLTKLRHPQVLTVQHPLEESRESLAFATEPVFASLANILGNLENMPQPTPDSIRNYKLFEVEIKYGLLQLGEGLAFLHNDVKLLHKNICPESIIMNKQGAWKIFGFDFCVLNQNTKDCQPFWPFVEYTPALHSLTQPNLDYLAPECTLAQTHSTASDIFSLGMLIYALHAPGGKSLFQCHGDYGKFKKMTQELKQLPSSKISCITEGLQEYVKMMLNTVAELRPDAHQLIKIPYFEDVGVKTLNYLDSLFQWDNLQKSQFFKGLPQIIQKLPHRVCIYRIVPCLIKEFVNPAMVPFVLPNVLQIAENCSKEEYLNYILPDLKPVMRMQDPIQILLIFMQKMELLLKLTPPEEIKSDVLPMLYRALESDTQQIQELCLSVLPTFASMIDYPAMKNALLPRIKKLCIATNYLSVRVNCLLCVGKLLEHLDKWLVLDEVLPFLPQIPSREPAVLMGILGIYKLALIHKKLGITKEFIATKILPFLMPLCIENGLTLNQFSALIGLVKEMVNQVENEHRVKLEQLNSIQKEQSSLNLNLQQSANQLCSAVQPKTGVDTMFSNLGLDSYMSDSLKSTTVNSSTELKNIATLSSNGSNNNLSLEEKRRILKEQEKTQIFRSQPSITPTPVIQKISPPSKNLTSTLIESNISQLNSPSSFSNNMSNWSHSQNLTSNKPSWDSVNMSLNDNAMLKNNSSNQMQNWDSRTINSQSSNQSSLMSQNWSSQTFGMNQNMHNQSNNQLGTGNNFKLRNTSPNNWSALDSLLPNTPKIPMNQMSSQQQPLLQSPSNHVTKELSKNDIIDLLS